MKPRASLQRSLTVSVLLLGLLFGTVGLGFAYWHARQSLRHTIGQTFLELARQGADKMGLILSREVEWVGRLAAMPEVTEALQDRTPLAFRSPRIQRWREEQERYFRSLVLIDRRGQLVGGVNTETTQSHYQRQSWWSAVMHEGRAWSGPIAVDDRGRSTWEVVVPIRGSKDAVVGAVKVVVEMERVLAAMLRARIGETGHLMLVSEDGRVLACPSLVPRLHHLLTLPRDSVRTATWWTDVPEDSHGQSGGMLGAAPVGLPESVVQDQLWYVVVRQAPEETDAPVVALLWRVSAFWVLAVGVVMWLCWRLAKRLVRPLTALIERVQAVEVGRPVPRLDLDLAERIEEIEALIHGFNVMADRLEAASRETSRYVEALEHSNRELVESEEHYRTLWNSAVDAKLIVDANGIIRHVNRRVESTLGCTSEELIGRPADALFLEPDQLRVRDGLCHVLSTASESSVFEAHVAARSGTVLTVEVDIVPLEHRVPVRRVLVQLSDVTERKQLEQQLVRSERLASLSQFASMFAHDIRNPLAGIKKTLEVMAQTPEARHPPLRSLLNDLQFTTLLLVGMINDMLDVYQDSYSGLPLLRSRFSIVDQLEDVARLFQPEAAARGVTIRTVCSEGDVVVSGDRRRLERVWINVVHNALKYSPSGGEVLLIVQTQAGVAAGAATAQEESLTALVEVQDNGPGVDPADLPHLFELFFRKKDGTDWRIGRGLGLHFCRLVVDAHHGSMAVANRPGGGAVFSVRLPCQEVLACPSPS